MRHTRKIAMVGLEWNRLYARLLAGALQYANTHPSLKVVIQPFTRTTPIATLAARIEQWGADGIFGPFTDAMLQSLMAVLKHPIPIVSNSFSAMRPGVVHILGDGRAFTETGVEHLRQLGIKNLGLLFTEPAPDTPLAQLSSFKRLTEPFSRMLALPMAEDQLLSITSNTLQVPAALAAWLQELPKPAGVLCPSIGAGRFLIECCARLGLRVPREIAIIGADEADVCLNCTPTLTSILPNLEILGSESVRILLGLLDGITPPTPMIKIKAVDLVVRESTGQHPPMLCDVAGALEYIQANATKGLSVTQLMRATQRSSEPTFYQCFHKATGKTPAEAIRDRQLEEVRRLLASTQLPVAVVSSMAGFSSSTTLGRLFRNVEGMTPLEYRKREKKD